MYDVPYQFDILLCAEVFYELFIGKRIVVSSQTSFYATKHGWILTGTFPHIVDPSAAIILYFPVIKSALVLFNTYANT